MLGFECTARRDDYAIGRRHTAEIHFWLDGTTSPAGARGCYLRLTTEAALNDPMSRGQRPIRTGNQVRVGAPTPG